MPAEVTPLKAVEPQALPYLTRSVTIRGTTYKFRELSVDENDECSNGAKEENGLVNGRTMMRLAIMSAAIEPKIGAETLSKMPQGVYLAICEVVNGLLDPATLDEDDKKPGKASSRSTS